jgi:hypothetical protein
MLQLSTVTKLSCGMFPLLRPTPAFDVLAFPHRHLIKFLPRSSVGVVRCMSTATDQEESNTRIVKTIDTKSHKMDWDDRIGIQSAWTNVEKGWKVQVDWQKTPFGAGLFAAQDIAAGTRIREGKNGINMLQFQSIKDIESFCKDDGDSESPGNESKLNYVKDYIWGFNPNADDRGYNIFVDNATKKLSAEHEVERVFAMWIPGNGLNHNSIPNTVYRPAKIGGTEMGIDLIALCDIQQGEELVDDYRRHGSAPLWLLEFSSKYNVALNFAECNDFVEQTDP